jgi:elongation factor P hydroxylase
VSEIAAWCLKSRERILLVSFVFGYWLHATISHI